MSYIYETQYNSPNFTESNDGREYIICHWWGDPNQNPSYEGVIDTLCNPNRQASAHFIATGTGRRVACIVGTDDTAWHAGDWYANTHSIGIEADPRCRDEDYDVVAELIANIRSAYGDLPLKRHSDFMATQCPGNYDLNRLDALARTKDGSGEWGDVTNIGQAPQPITSREQIAQAYIEVLERSYDEGGMQTYLNSGFDIERIKNEMRGSKEYEYLQAVKLAETNKPVVTPPVIVPTQPEPTVGDVVSPSKPPVDEKTTNNPSTTTTLLEDLKIWFTAILNYLSKFTRSK